MNEALNDMNHGIDMKPVLSGSEVTEQVKEKYGAAARSGLSSAQAGVTAVAEAFGYTQQQLASIPQEANLGLSCGNPTAMASLKPGEVVVDLGSGGGIDVLLAAQQVGSTGKAIGIDMTESMVELAKRNAAAANGGIQAENVEFHLASIDQMPLPDDSVDCVISNCVINLAADKPAVFREIARVLKPSGRLAVSDIALKQTLPAELANDVAAFVGCIAGAIEIEQYRQGLIDAGFAEVEVIDSGADLNAYAKVENQAGCCSPAMSQITGPAKSDDEKCHPGLQLMTTGCCSANSQTSTTANDIHSRLGDLLQRYDVNAYAASVKVFAVKKGRS